MELRSLNVRLKSLLIAVQVKESQTRYNINKLHIATIDPKHQPCTDYMSSERHSLRYHSHSVLIPPRTCLPPSATLAPTLSALSFTPRQHCSPPP